MKLNHLAPEYGNGLTNHLPMALEALHSMQASNQQLERFYNHSIAKLELIDNTSSTASLKDWQAVCSLKGQYSHFTELRQYFSDQIGNNPQHPAIANYVQKLAPAISCAAFHPIIRLAHALQANNAEEVASALAYWVYAYTELAWPDNSSYSDCSLKVTVEQLLTEHSWPEGRLGNGLVTDDMKNVSLQPNFDHLTFRPKVHRVQFSEMESSILSLYLATNDFTVLHGVTGTYAVRVVMEQCSYNEDLVLYLWQGLVCAYLSKGMTQQHIQDTLTALTNFTCYTREQIRKLACESLNDHSIKLAAVCLKMHEMTNDEKYLLAISRQLQLQG